MTISNKVLAPLRAVHNWLHQDELPAEELEKEVRYEEIRKKLSSIRKEQYILERIASSVSPDYLEEVSLQIKLSREREHLLIKEAKQLRGVPINIQSSLMEYEQRVIDTLGANAPITD